MIIIPARLKSTRFPNKILCEIKNMPMFIATAKQVEGIDEICIAVDDEEVLKIALKYGFKAILTSKDHKSGTDRINEACIKLGLKDDEVIINVQADEPFIERENIAKFKEFASKCLKEEAFMASCFKKTNSKEAQDSNLVKVVTDKYGFALYFSRSKIPFEREAFKEDFKAHLGIYAYSVANLKEFCSFQSSNLENAEKLEQLRALENGKKIKMLEISSQSIGIDSREDYERALSFLKGMG
ncbi:3-deoxy-manno-octulosonate cytidylyltransferase [Campylobacter sp. MIT 99-7217]|uniref:3-deoxy-manno-octulosonate cytidylyltransferase n=1 Tax=Campylobacter sp. MIT 99-7217 TaxID=535091 RepID=UPI00115B8860|nr:3-deoxy-manno-octulosonate cytidylyltransferase [Campylobacter sp. MIT 99-7217]TQR34646.1 3-deoxy-manno-octulosonate cytidylyltransferase [Campylobacter sp. MIT 99-7217]